MKKGIKAFLRFLGAVLAVVGGFVTVTSLLVAALGLLGQLETESYVDRIWIGLAALVYALPFYGLYRLGRWMWRKKTPVAKPNATSAPVPPAEEEPPVPQEWVFLGTGVPQDWDKEPVSAILWPHDDRIELFIRKGYHASETPDRASEEYHILPPDWLESHDAHDLSELIREKAGILLQPEELIKTLPGLRLGIPIKTIPKDKRFTDVLLYQGPLGSEQLGNQKLYLQLKQGCRWELHCVSYLKKANKYHRDFRDVTEAFAPSGNIRPLLDAARELTGVHLDPEKVRRRIRQEPLLSSWDTQKRPGTFPVDVPPLEKAVESGPIGAVDRTVYRDQEGTIHTIHSSGDNVKYYFFEDGTLALVGKGATRAVDQGGFDGRSYFEPEPSPFSDRVRKETRRVVAAQGVTHIGHGLLMRFSGIEELHLADSVREVHYNQMHSLTVLRSGEDFQSFDGFTGKLRELVLPEGAVELARYNSGTLPGVKTDDPEIQKRIDEKLALEFATTIGAMFRMYPYVAMSLADIAKFDPLFAARTLSSLKWHSKGKDVMVELPPRLEGLCGIPLVPRKELELRFAWEYGEYAITYAAALAHAAWTAKPNVIRCEFVRMRVWDAGMKDWWRTKFPDTELIMTMAND